MRDNAAMVRPPVSLPFRLYFGRLSPNKSVQVIFVYWDSQDRKRALIEPFLYEHAARGDHETRLRINKLPSCEGKPETYSWAIGDSLEPDARKEFFAMIEAKRGEFEEFVKGCFEDALKCPLQPFRAAFV